MSSLGLAEPFSIPTRPLEIAVSQSLDLFSRDSELLLVYVEDSLVLLHERSNLIRAVKVLLRLPTVHLWTVTLPPDQELPGSVLPELHLGDPAHLVVALFLLALPPLLLHLQPGLLLHQEIVDRLLATLQVLLRLPSCLRPVFPLDLVPSLLLCNFHPLDASHHPLSPRRRPRLLRLHLFLGELSLGFLLQTGTSLCQLDLGLLPSLIARALAGLVLDDVFVELLGQPLRARLLLARLQAGHSEPTGRASPLGLYQLAVIDSLLKVFLDPGRVRLDVDAPLLGHEAFDGGRSAALPWVVPQRLDRRLHHLRHRRNLWLWFFGNCCTSFGLLCNFSSFQWHLVLEVIFVLLLILFLVLLLVFWFGLRSP